MDEGTNNIEEEYTEIVDESSDQSSADQSSADQSYESSTYNELYVEQLELTNSLLSGQIFFLGLIFGVILFKIFWDRWKV